jgi:hypothetical protein
MPKLRNVMKTEQDVETFERLSKQLHSFLAQVSELSSKKPNDPVNKFKLKFINATLEDLNKVLAAGRPFQDFSVFDSDDLPSNSDVVVMLDQYEKACATFRADNSTYATGSRKWIINGKVSEIWA